ncbi:MAG: a-factor receptor [Pycnora praestabilis]|nr:MAG: a-factor receptor [Pycnora praestabilis]
MDSSLSYTVFPAAIAIPTLSVFTIILGVPPFVWHLKNRNLAACSLIFWVLLMNLFNLINAIIWASDDTTRWWDGNVLCDIEVKLMLAGTVGTAGSLACIMRNLANVLNTDRQVLIPSRAQRRRQLALGILFCYGCPIYRIAIHYVVQPNRYYIFAIAGCTPSVDNSWPSIVLIFIWPPVLCLVATYYSVLVIIRLHKYRRQFSQILSGSSTSLNKSRFLRLFIISVVLTVIFLPVQLYLFSVNMSFPRLPYSWDLVHGPQWWNIVMVPTGGVVEFDRWIWIASGFLLFIFFGLGKDALDMYRRALVSLGIAKVFPSLTQQANTQTLYGNRTEGSFSSRAKLVFKKKHSMTESSPSRTDSISTEVVTPSPSNPKKTFIAMAQLSSADHSVKSYCKSEKALPSPPTSSKPVHRFATAHYRSASTQTDEASGLDFTADEEAQARGTFAEVWVGRKR